MRSERTRSRKKIAGDATPVSFQGRKSRRARSPSPNACRETGGDWKRSASSDATQETPASPRSASAASESAPSGGHIPFGRKPKCRSNVVWPSAICARASSGCEKRGEGSVASGSDCFATLESARSGRIGW